MAYLGSEAYRLDQWAEADPSPRRDWRREPERETRRFRTLEGGHLDADARRGVSPQFVARVRAVVLAVAFIVALGCVRVALSAGTVTLMRTNTKLETSITQTRQDNKDLQVTRSLLSSSDRVCRIAAQNYGMVPTTPSATIQVGE